MTFQIGEKKITLKLIIYGISYGIYTFIDKKILAYQNVFFLNNEIYYKAKTLDSLINQNSTVFFITNLYFESQYCRMLDYYIRYKYFFKSNFIN